MSWREREEKCMLVKECWPLTVGTTSSTFLLWNWKGHRDPSSDPTRNIEMDREERRRRIVERGSDRLALITGSIQSLDSPLTPSPKSRNYSHIRTQSAPAGVHAYNDLSLSQDKGHYQSPQQPHLNNGTFFFSNSCYIYIFPLLFPAI